ncbi:MAG: hypothetical protein ACKOAF_05025 [Actinomycetes bacterium]
MTDHLPECRHATHTHAPDPWCDCGILRACEQRRDRENAPAVAAMCNDEYASGYSDALDAAEAAVAAHRPRYFTNPGGGGPSIWEGRDGFLIDRDRTLAAIRVLKEKR